MRQGIVADLSDVAYLAELADLARRVDFDLDLRGPRRPDARRDEWHLHVGRFDVRGQRPDDVRTEPEYRRERLSGPDGSRPIRERDVPAVGLRAGRRVVRRPLVPDRAA